MKAIKLKNIDKKFIIAYQRGETDKGFFHSFPRQKSTTEFWALRKIDMEIDKGKVVGIVGRNGAGKSTLLNILAGITTPTSGNIEINGRVCCLLTLGAGFQNELTGRENIYLNSSILGMSRSDIDRKYSSIVEFSELDGFLDSPLRTYSQGMRLRLGFSVAVHMDFDILLIDEILSVGDVSFQKKCFFKIDEFRKQQKTMIITTQSLNVIERLCEEAYLLENGEIVQHGHPQKISNHYLELLNENKLADTFYKRFGRLKWWSNKMFWDKKEGSWEIKIINVKTYNSNGKQTNRFETGESVKVEVCFVVEKEIADPHFGVAIFREDGVYCYGPNTSFDGYKIEKLTKGKGVFSIEYKSLLLKPGIYRFSAAIWDKDELWAYDYHIGCYKFEIVGDTNDNQLLELKYKWEPDYFLDRFRNITLKKIEGFSDIDILKDNTVISSDIELVSHELVDSLDNLKSVFSTGEDVKLKITLKFLKKLEGYYIWVGLFRGDGVYCHGSWRKLKEEIVFLRYLNLPLLRGDYYFSLGIWEKDKEKPVLYQAKIAIFNISFLGKDHGTVYLEHSWDWKLS